MAFAGINYRAVIIAAVAGWLIGAIYHRFYARSWILRLGDADDTANAETAALAGTLRGWLPFVVTFLATLAIAYVLAGMVGHLGVVTIHSAVISGLILWAGLILTTMMANQALSGGRYPLTLALIKASTLALVIIVMGIIIGWMGV